MQVAIRDINKARAPESTLSSMFIIINDGSRVRISVGHAFENVRGDLGIVMQMESDGIISKWRVLYNQANFDKLLPGALAALRPFYVVETNLTSTDHVQPKDVKRVFLNKNPQLVQAHDLKGTGDVFTVGKAEFGFDDNYLIPSMGAFPHRPMILCGLPAPSADELVRAVNLEQKFFGEQNCAKYSPVIAVQIEDAILSSAWDRFEEKGRGFGPLELHGVPVSVMVSLLHQNIGPGGHTSRVLKSCISVAPNDGWNDSGMIALMGRNARTTDIPSMGVSVELGPPTFKYRLLPFEKVVVVYGYFKLLNLARTAIIQDNLGSVSAKRDVASTMGDHMRCSLCLRYCGRDPEGPRFACVCGLDQLPVAAQDNAPGAGHDPASSNEGGDEMETDRSGLKSGFNKFDLLVQKKR